MLACGLATHFVRSNVGSLVTYIFNHCTTKHPFLYTATKNWTLKLSGTCYTNPDIINVVYVLYQSITPSKYPLFLRGCHCWKNRLKRSILPILLLFVVLSISLLNIHHWKRTALWRGNKSVSNWMAEICPDSYFINLILWCSLAGWKSSTNVFFPKGQLKKLYLLLWVWYSNDSSFLWVHFYPAELINVLLIRSKWP